MKLDAVDHDTGEVTGNSPPWPSGLVDVDAVTGDLDHLLTLFRSAKISNEDLSEAIKATAEKAGVSASALRRYVTARASEKYDEKRAESAQLMLLFEEVG